ncbi:hypothetical protein [Cyclobacterium marinum]|uniref:hypothetical protein n=1 Tax=Cyclobacterium marinum TaxID=104 RepID=UPI0030DC55BD|tara:strand:- start:75694 stop:76377 length:684 start_codon:yes stop_codon:yes gene_type:complete
MKKDLSLFFAIFLIPTLLNAQTFTGSFDLVVRHHFPNGNERIDTISYFLGKAKSAIIIYGKRRDPDMRMVFNKQDSTITNLFEMNGKKGGYILPMDKKHWPGMQYALRSFNSGPRKKLNYTGNEATLEGYYCREVVAEIEEYAATMMLAEDIKISMSSVLSYQSVGAGKSQDESSLFDKFGVQILPLFIKLKSKVGKADVVMRVVNIKESFPEAIFDTEGHTLISVE